MPEIKKRNKKATPAAPVAPQAPAAPDPLPAPDAAAAPVVGEDGKALPILYEAFEVLEYSTAVARGPLTAEDCAMSLGWETEKQFQARKCAEKPGSKPEHWLFGDTYHCKDVAGEKVRCSHNANNRSFDGDWCEALVHTILHGQWAGPHTIPGGTVNGETIRISQYGRVLSGQHSMTACKLADEWLHKCRADLGLDVANAKYPTWAKHNHVFIETVVATGMSEDPRVLMSVDYVKPRTAADVFYTSKVFRDSTPAERKELCRILAGAVDFLWTRTAARGYRTHPEIVAFLDRHKRLLKCAEHVFNENGTKNDRRISKWRLNLGHCAAIHYLQGCAGTGTDGDVYRNEDPAPSEKNLDWSLWDRAQDFWVELAGGLGFRPVRLALGRLIASDVGSEDNQGLGGRTPEKLAILAKAWDVYRDHPDSAGAPFSDSDMAPDGVLSLSYSDLDDKGNRLPNDQIKLVDVADFGGIDCPEVVATPKVVRGGAPEPLAPTKDEIERATQESLERRRAEQARIDATKAAKKADRQ